MSNVFPEFEDASSYEAGSYERDYHPYVSVQLCELVEGGWVKWYTVLDDGTVTPNEDWVWDYYDMEQYKRLCDKLNARYWFDEISLMPPLKWKTNILRKLNEIMPKYKMLYKVLNDGVDPMQVSGKYGKSRDIYSEFPETLLNGNSDYVSHGSDREYEDVETGSFTDTMDYLSRKYNDVDVMVLDDLEDMFSTLYTVSVNGF